MTINISILTNNIPDDIYESTPKSDIARHCEARSNPILLIIYMLRLLHFVRNDGKPLFGADSFIKSLNTLMIQAVK